MAEQEVKFIVRGRFVSPDGADLGPAENEQVEQDDRTVSELTAALEAAEVEIPSGSKKADLLKLAQQHGV